MAKNQFSPLDNLRQIKHNRVRWSNFLINAAIDCSALEKRALYLISAWVKENFVVKNLGVPDNWKKLYIKKPPFQTLYTKHSHQLFDVLEHGGSAPFSTFLGPHLLVL